MRCPKCDADRPYVIESRRLKGSTRRTRRCRDGRCGNVWETLEVVMTDRMKRKAFEKGDQLDLLDLLEA